MKSIKFALIATGIVLSASAYSQTDSSQKNNSATASSAQQSTLSTTASAQPLVTPNFGPHYIAILGNYTSSPETAATEKNITISGDQENPGKIWIEGLTDAKIYALRKEMSGTYKIPEQKSNDNTIAEGTVIYDNNSKHINICLGCKYKDESPADAFTPATADVDNSTANNSGNTKSISKNKKPIVNKVVSFTGNKTDAGTASK